MRVIFMPRFYFGATAAETVTELRSSEFGVRSRIGAALHCAFRIPNLRKVGHQPTRRIRMARQGTRAEFGARNRPARRFHSELRTQTAPANRTRTTLGMRKPPMLILNADDVRRSLAMAEAIEAMKRAFAAFSSGEALVPPRTHLTVPQHSGV